MKLDVNGWSNAVRPISEARTGSERRREHSNTYFIFRCSNRGTGGTTSYDVSIHRHQEQHLLIETVSSTPNRKAVESEAGPPVTPGGFPGVTIPERPRVPDGTALTLYNDSDSQWKMCFTLQSKVRGTSRSSLARLCTHCARCSMILFVTVVDGALDVCYLGANSKPL